MLAVAMLFGSVAVMGIIASAAEPFAGAKTAVIDKYNYCLISAENPVGFLKIVPDETAFYEFTSHYDDGDTVAYLYDAKGNVQKDSANKDLAKDGGKITVNAGFFAKIIDFFKGLFGALPSVVVKP